MCINGVWGTVCNSGISYNDARVICLDLGYQTGLESGLVFVQNLLLF